MPGVNYFYVVSAVNAAGESAPSIAVSAMRAPGDAGLWVGGGFNAWPRGARITFPGYTRSETLTNIPLLVTLSTNIPRLQLRAIRLADGRRICASATRRARPS